MVATNSTAMPAGQARWQRSFPPLLSALCALGFLLLLLSACGSSSAEKRAIPAPVAQTVSLRQVQVHSLPLPLSSPTSRCARSHLYRFSTTNVGLMQPAVDAQDNVWVGEMNANRLGYLNTQSGLVTGWQPPGGRYGIMTTILDAQGNVWFAELDANYIGRFEKRQQTFQIFPLGTWRGSPLGPQDLHFDSSGRLWFTAEEAGAIGQLDPQTGSIHLWPVPVSPATLTLTPKGLVWFGADGAIGSLNPVTGQLTLYDLPDRQTQVYGLAADATGHLWFTEVLPGKLAMLDPATATLMVRSVPARTGGPPALYGLVIDHAGTLWFVDVGANALVRYVPRRHTLTFFPLCAPHTVPFGLTLAPDGTLWFSAGAVSANYIGEMAPIAS